MKKAATRQPVGLGNDFGCSVAKQDVGKICQVKKEMFSQIKHLCVSPECYALTKGR